MFIVMLMIYGGDAALYRLGQKPVRRGLVHDKWPFRLDISVEYQDKQESNLNKHTNNNYYTQTTHD